MDNLLAVHRVTIPALPCSLPRPYHSDFEEVRNVGDSWIMSQCKPRSHEVTKFLIQSQYPMLASLTYANTQRKRLLPITKFICWVFLMDDINDDLNNMGRDALATDQLCQCLVLALQAKNPDPAPKIVTMALDWWTEISKDLTVRQQSRFIHTLEDTLDAVKSEISHRQKKRIPDVQSYILRRRRSSIMQPFFILLEYGLGMELDEELLENLLILKLHEAVTDHVCWVNDLLSLQAEYSRGEFDNLPSVICFNGSRDYQESIYRVCRLIEQRDTDFARLANELKKSELMKKPGLLEYIQGLDNWMAGNLYWTYISARYHGVDAKPKSPHLPLPIVLRPQQNKFKLLQITPN